MFCPYPPERENHPVFVYLISDARYKRDQQKQDLVPYVLLCENPLDDIHRQNRRSGYRGADQNTKSGHGHLQIELILGPFPIDVGTRVQRLWKSRSRKMIQRIRTGLSLSRQFKSTAWCRDVEWIKAVYRSATKQIESSS